MSAVEIKLTKEDQSRINKCDYYRSTQIIMKSVEEYKHFEVGTAVLIKHKSSNNFLSNGSWHNNANSTPSKYLIIENDNGFVFAKRIISSGEPGKTVQCLTIEYSTDNYEIVTDEDYLDSLLLDEEYDPTTSAKEEKKKKGKASRTNNKYRVRFKEPFDAYAYIKGLKKGDKLWSAWTTFGDGITEYEVKEIQTYALTPKPPAQRSYYSRYNRNYGDANQSFIDEGFAIGVKVILKELSNESGYISHRDSEVYFYNVCQKEDYKHSSKMLYTRKPIKPQDVA